MSSRSGVLAVLIATFLLGERSGAADAKSSSVVRVGLSAPRLAATSAADDDDDDEDDDDDDDDDDDGSGEPSSSGASRGDDKMPAGAADADAGADLDVVSRYVWRGLALSKGPVLQPEVWASYRDLTVSAWANVLLTSEAELHRVSSAEVEAAYQFKWRRVEIDPVVTKYWFTDVGPVAGTTECAANGAVHFGPFALTTTQSLDVEATPGAYIGALGGRLAGKRGRWEGKITVDVAWATASFNRAYWDRAITAFDLAEGAAEVRFRATPLFSMAVHGTASTLLDTALRAEAAKPTLLTIGLSLSLNH